MNRWLPRLVLLVGIIPSSALACPETGLTPLSAVAAIEDPAPIGARVDVRGIVTGDFRGEDHMRGFFLQSAEPAVDGYPVGLFVFAPDLAPGADFSTGDEVHLQGQVGEFRDRRQINRVESVQPCGKAGLPTPTPLPFPAAERSDWPRLDGVLIAIDTPLTVTGNFDIARYGSLELAAGGRLFRPSQTPQASAEDNRARRIILDDGSYRQWPDSVPYLDEEGTRRTGSVLPGLSAILTHAFGAWRLHPPEPESVRFKDHNPRPAPPEKAESDWRAVGFNVENYFLTLGQRGAGNRDELARQRAQLQAVAQGLDGDLLGLVEVENRPDALPDLARRLGEAAGIGGGYAHFNLDTPVGTDAIRVALAWHPERVTLLDGPWIDDASTHHRPPIAGHFRFHDAGPGKIVVVIHHKAKSGCPDTGDIDRGQGCWNQRRAEQSQALATFLDRLRQKANTDRVLIIGDINSYAEEDPVHVLRDAGYSDLLRKQVPAADHYTYVFRGESGNLDVAIASPAIDTESTTSTIWHINADEPAALHTFTPDHGPWRSSDHDPVVIDFHYKNLAKP